MPYLLIAIICGYIGRDLDRDQWILTVLIVLAATELNLVLDGLLLAASGQYIHLLAYLFEFSVPMLIYHGIVALPIDHIVWKLRRDDMFYGFGGYRW